MKYLTTYTDDLLGNLLFVNQSGQIVATCYGNLSGTTCDSSGYDDLNRVVRKSYSDGTPTVTYLYDVEGTGF